MLILLTNFNGRFSDFYEKYIEKILPPSAHVKAMHDSLLNYFTEKPDLYIVRNFSKYQQRGKYLEVGKCKFVVSDNEAALGIYGNCFEKVVSESHIADMIKNQSFPIGMSRDSKKNETKEEWTLWGRTKWAKKNFSEQSLTHAHLFDAANGIEEKVTRESLQYRMTRLLHPANHFPMPTHFTQGETFYVDAESGNPVDLSTQYSVKAYIVRKFSERYKEIWEEFLRMTDGKHKDFPNKDDDGGPFNIESRQRPPKENAQAHTGKGTRKRLASTKLRVPDSTSRSKFEDSFICIRKHQVEDAQLQIESLLPPTYASPKARFETDRDGWIIEVEHLENNGWENLNSLINTGGETNGILRFKLGAATSTDRQYKLLGLNNGIYAINRQVRNRNSANFFPFNER